MGSRDESGEFTAVADGLAERGIASMRIDFPGCNESTESFLEYNFKNMSDDLDAALALSLIHIYLLGIIYRKVLEND